MLPKVEFINVLPELFQVDHHLRESQFMLEEYSIMHSMRLVQIEVSKYFEQNNFFNRADSTKALSTNFMQKSSIIV